MTKIANEIQPIPSDWYKRPIITQHNAKNELVVRTYGKTSAELLRDHLNGKCGLWCEHCFNAAIDSTKEDTMTYHDLYEPDGYTCPVCGGRLEGDDYTSPMHCENVTVPDGAEADSGPYYCEVPDGIYPDPDKEEVPF